MPDVHLVTWGRRVQRQLEVVPVHIRMKFHAWVAAVFLAGIREVRRTPGFHDEPLSGRRSGQRSIRLNRSWRAIYVERNEIELLSLEVIEVSHHEY